MANNPNDPLEQGPVRRLRYFHGEFLKSEDFEAEQSYHRRMRQIQNRVLLQPGVIQGLVPSVANGQLSVTPGLAIDAYGRQILVPDPGLEVDVASLSAGDLYIEYGDQPTLDPHTGGTGGDNRFTQSPRIVAGTAGGGVKIGTLSGDKKSMTRDSMPQRSDLLVPNSELRFSGDVGKIFLGDEPWLSLDKSLKTIASFRPITVLTLPDLTNSVFGAKVGIGTALPDQPLTIRFLGDVACNWKYSSGGRGNQFYKEVGRFGRSTSAATEFAGALELDKDGSTTVHLDADADSYFTGGSLGIGTPSPDHPLTIEFEGSQVDAFNWRRTVSGQTRELGWIGYSAAADFAGALALENDGTAQIRLDSAGSSYFTGGKVGIGTPSPDHPLTIEFAGSQAFNWRRTVSGQTKELGWIGYSASNPSEQFIGALEIHNNGNMAIRIDGHSPKAAGNKGPEILFRDNGEIRSLDFNHRFMFNRSMNIMELREFGDIMFSPGATSGDQTARAMFAWNGGLFLDLSSNPKNYLNDSSSGQPGSTAGHLTKFFKDSCLFIGDISGNQLTVYWKANGSTYQATLTGKTTSL